MIVHGKNIEHLTYFADSVLMTGSPYLVDHCKKLHALTVAANWLSGDLNPPMNPFPSLAHTLVRRVNIIRHDYRTTWDFVDLMLGFILVRQWQFLHPI